MKFLLIIILLAALVTCTAVPNEEIQQHPVLPGIDVLLTEKLDLVADKRIGLITNPTGVSKNLQSSIDLLHAHSNIDLAAIYGPEHGARGNVTAGGYVETITDEKTGLPMYSLYGRTKKPTAEMLAGIDALLFDIQDIGVRPYTYIYTMAYAMQAAAEYAKEFIVLDRPNPMGGTLTQGPVLEKEFSSFIGLYPIPYVHGMTVGELARLFNSEFNINCNLTVVPMKNWQREMTWEDTGLMWIPTSPHVPYKETPFYLACTGSIGELHVVNEGVGYTAPFQYIGAEWINAEKFAQALNAANLPGIYFRPVHYRPYYHAKKGTSLQGVQLHIQDAHTIQPILIELTILTTLRDMYNTDFFNRDASRRNMFDKSMGTDKVRHAIEAGESAASIFQMCEQGLRAFSPIREKYLLY